MLDINLFRTGVLQSVEQLLIGFLKRVYMSLIDFLD